MWKICPLAHDELQPCELQHEEEQELQDIALLLEPGESVAIRFDDMLWKPQ